MPIKQIDSVHTKFEVSRPKLNPTGMVGHLQNNIKIKSVHNSIPGKVGREGFFMGKQIDAGHAPTLKGKCTDNIYEARGKHIA